MALRLAYLTLARVLSWLALLARSEAMLGAIQGDDHGPGVAPSTVTMCRSPVGLRRRRHRDEHRVRLPDPTRARRHGGGVETRGLRASGDDEFERILDVNLTGTYRLARAFGPRMAQRGKGGIINFSSFRALVAELGQYYSNTSC